MEFGIVNISANVTLGNLSFLTDFRDTWAFLGGRVKDAFDLKKSVQEVALECGISSFSLLFRILDFLNVVLLRF